MALGGVPAGQPLWETERPWGLPRRTAQASSAQALSPSCPQRRPSPRTSLPGPPHPQGVLAVLGLVSRGLTPRTDPGPGTWTVEPPASPAWCPGSPLHVPQRATAGRGPQRSQGTPRLPPDQAWDLPVQPRWTADCARRRCTGRGHMQRSHIPREAPAAALAMRPRQGKLGDTGTTGSLAQPAPARVLTLALGASGPLWSQLPSRVLQGWLPGAGEVSLQLRPSRAPLPCWGHPPL